MEIITNQEELIVGNIYHVKHFYKGNINTKSWLIRFEGINKNDVLVKRCMDIKDMYYYQFDFKQVWGSNKEFLEYCRPATQDECDWFEYCELEGGYINKEKVLMKVEKRQLIEFIQENNLL